MGFISRRDFVKAAGLAAPALYFAGNARAAGFPDKDIAFIIPYSAGGGFDNYVRAISPALEQYLPNRVNVVPTNVPSGGGSRGIGQLYRAKPDGYTIAIFNIPGMFVLQQQGGASYDLSKISWLGSIGRDHYALGVGAKSPLRSVADLKALSATRPVKFTSTGPEATAYAATLIGTELIGIRTQMITGYKGSNDYVIAAIRGDGDAVVTTLPLMRRLQDGNELRILATFETKSSVPGAEDATTLAQPELSQIVLERLIGAPPGVPAEIKAALSEGLAKAVADPETRAWAKRSDSELGWETPERAAEILADQAQFFQKWKKFLTPS